VSLLIGTLISWDACSDLGFSSSLKKSVHSSQNSNFCRVAPTLCKKSLPADKVQVSTRSRQTKCARRWIPTTHPLPVWRAINTSMQRRPS